jgi:hypothetical protein
MADTPNDDATALVAWFEKRKSKPATYGVLAIVVRALIDFARDLRRQIALLRREVGDLKRELAVDRERRRVAEHDVHERELEPTSK